tara:strand:+ start:2376 stop:4961 length:2586 start_codon:yes stop_codon:yes gene_type:complete
MTQAEMRNLGRFSPPSYPQSECFRPVTGNGAGTEMMASGAFAVVPTPVSARTVAGCRRGTPWTKRTGVGRVGGHTKEPPNEVRLHGRISQRVPPLHAVREPSKGERGVELASTSFGGHEDNQRGAESDTNTTHTDAARRVRNAKTNAARYHSRVGVSVDEDEEETVETSASGGSTAATKQSTSTPTKPVKKGGGRRGKSYPLSRRGTGGTQPLNEGKGGIAASKLTSKLNKRKTKYNRPSSSGIVDKSMDRSVDMSGDDSDSELLVRGNDDRPRWLSNTHTKKPGQQAQQKRNSSGPQKNGMRPGERIVAALQKVPVADTVERFSGATTDSMSSKTIDETALDNKSVDYGSIDSAVTRPLGGKANFSAPTLNFAIKELGERGDFNRAHALFLWMRAQGAKNRDVDGENKYAPNRHTLASLFSCACEKQHAKTVTRVWRDSCLMNANEFRNSEVGSAAIAALARCENWPAALQVWQDLGDSGEPRNIFVYTAVLSALRDAKRWEEAGDVFRQMRDETGCSPNATCAGLTLSTFDAARKWREGTLLAKRFGDVYGVPSDERLTHAVISVAGRAGDTAFARKTLEKALADRSHVVTTYTYNCLLGGYARSADWPGAQATFTALVAARFQPDAYTYTHLLSAAERAGEHGAADEVWAQATSGGQGQKASATSNSSIGRKKAAKRPAFKPHTVMCGAYVHCLGTQGRWMEAEAIVEKMRSVWGVGRNAAVYNALLGALVKGNKIDRALQVFDSMQSETEQVLPTEITFMLLIRACVDDGLSKKAKELSDVRDALAESGALENDFSKYESRDDALRASAFNSSSSELKSSVNRGVPHSNDMDYGSVTQDAGRLSAGLPPREKGEARE